MANVRYVVNKSVAKCWEEPQLCAHNTNSQHTEARACLPHDVPSCPSTAHCVVALAVCTNGVVLFRSECLHLYWALITGISYVSEVWFFEGMLAVVHMCSFGICRAESTLDPGAGGPLKECYVLDVGKSTSLGW